MSEEDKELEPLELIGSIVGSEPIVYAQDDDLFKRKFIKENVPGVHPHQFAKILANKVGNVKSKQWQDDTPLSMYSAADCAQPTYNLEYLAKLYGADPYHAAAVDALVDNIVGLGYYLDFSRKTEKARIKASKKSPDNKAKLEEKLEDIKFELSQFIDSLNQNDTFDETLEKVARDRFTMGNGYLEVGRNVDGTIGYIGHIPAHTMRIRRLRDGFVQYVGSRPIYFRNFGDRSTPNPFGSGTPNEIIHFKRYSPEDTFYGVPEVTSAIVAIAGNKFANNYNIEFFENKAVPRYIVKTRGINLSLAQQKELMKIFEANVKGRSHRTIIIPLPRAENIDIEFEAIETKVQEGSFANYTKANIETILARHRVPANRLGSANASGTSANRDADKIFKESVCRPQQRIFEKLIGRVIGEISNMFVFKLTEYTLTDEDQQSIIDERDLRNGVLVPDERRNKLGLPPRPDGNGDEAIDPLSLQEKGAKATAELAAQNAKSAEKIATKNAASPAATQARAEQASNGRRERDAERSAGRTNAPGAPATRNANGEGRKTS